MDNDSIREQIELEIVNYILAIFATDGNSPITYDMLKKIKHKLFLKKHPDKSEEDGYAIQWVKYLLTPDRVYYWTVKMGFIQEDNEEDNTDSEEDSEEDSQEGGKKDNEEHISISAASTEASIQRIQRMLSTEKEVELTSPTFEKHAPAEVYSDEPIGHHGERHKMHCVRKRTDKRKSYAHIDNPDLFIDRFVSIVKTEVFKKRGLSSASVQAYGSAFKKLLRNTHPIKISSSPLTDAFVDDMFKTIGSDFNAWSKTTEPEKKRGHPADINGSGHACLRLLFNSGEMKMQHMFTKTLEEHSV